MEQSRVPVHVPHGRQGRFEAQSPIAIDASVYFDNTGDIIIGRGCSFSRGAAILTHEHYHDRDLPLFEAEDRKGVVVGGIVIGDDVFIGTQAIITASCRNIGTGAIVGAGAVVTKDILPYEIWAGNPARKIGERK